MWGWFTKQELDYAVGNITYSNQVARFDIKGYTSRYPKRLKPISAFFQAGQRMLLTLDVPMKGMNSSRHALYGEVPTPADLSNSAISLLSHDGVNVFVRNSNQETVPFSILFLPTY